MPPSTDLGRRLHAARIERGFSLDDLAERAGISKSHVSRIESASRQPSIMALLRIASALGTSASTLLGAEVDGTSVVFGPGTEAQVNNGLTVIPLGHMHGGVLESFHVRVPPGAGDGELLTHLGEECVYVLEGTLALRLGDDHHVVPAGSAAHFDAGIPHALEALGETPVSLLLVTAHSGMAPHD